jgi:hypothetical protein
MRFFQSPSEARLAVPDPREREEAILKVTRQKETVLLVWSRPPLGVQYPLNALDDHSALRQKEFEEFDMGLERHLAHTRSPRPLFRRKERVTRHTTKGFANHADGADRITPGSALRSIRSMR